MSKKIEISKEQLVELTKTKTVSEDLRVTSSPILTHFMLERMLTRL